MTRVAVVVLNWNCAEDTIRCVDSLLDQKPLKPDVIIVDNFSSDNSVEILTARYSYKDSVNLIINSYNAGFAGGVNAGFRQCLDKTYDFIGTLNPDAIADELWLGQLLEGFAGDDRVGIGVGLLLDPSGEIIDSAGELYSSWGIPSPRARGEASNNAPTDREYVFGATGGAVIYKADLLRTIGLFDERFFMYYEDADLSFRAQLAGFKVIYNPKAIAYHKTGSSSRHISGLTTRQALSNLPVVFIKNVPLRLWNTILPRFIIAYGLFLGRAIMSRRFYAALVGFSTSISLIPHAFTRRFSIQRDRVVSIKYIKSIIYPEIPPDQNKLRAFRKFFTRP